MAGGLHGLRLRSPLAANVSTEGHVAGRALAQERPLGDQSDGPIRCGGGLQHPSGDLANLVLVSLLLQATRHIRV